MAVAFQAKMTAGNQTTLQAVSGVTSASSTGLTVSSGATLVVGLLCIQNAPSAPSMTWGGVAMTAGPILTVVASHMAAIFYLINPTPGTGPLAAAWTGTGDVYMSGLSFTGTDTSTGINVADSVSTSNATGPSAMDQTITSDVNGATVACYISDGDSTGMTQTPIFTYQSLNPGGAASYAMGGTSNVHQFTNTAGAHRVIVGVHVIAPALTWEQEGYQWRRDDGTEATATLIGGKNNPL